MCCQRWPGLCSGRLGSEHFVCVCRVKFRSSVNVVDYFLRDQNWLPRIRPPSIFLQAPCRTQGKAVWSRGSWVKESGGRRALRFPSRWQSSQATRYSISASAVTAAICQGNVCERNKNKCDLETWSQQSVFLLLFFVAPPAQCCRRRIRADFSHTQKKKCKCSNRLENYIRNSTWPSHPPRMPAQALACVSPSVWDGLWVANNPQK